VTLAAVPGGLRYLAAVLILSSVLSGCITGDGDRSGGSDPVIAPGDGVFTFDGYHPLRDRPVQVWYAAPADPPTAEIIIVMHGTGRSARDYRADWEPLLRGRNVLLLVPEFSESGYPGAASYNLGNMLDEQGELRSEEQWSFHVVEALFDFVVTEVHSEAKDFALFGHSAGAQFVHRFVEFMPEHRARVAVAANAGWYTVPNGSVEFPYGLQGSPAREEELASAFASNLVVLLGADDIDPGNDSLRHDEHSDAQGLNRLERGLHFYLTSRDVAARRSMPFTWRLIVTPGIAHSHSEMARVAAPLLIDAFND
jgi:alpha-beta hydrolase superfamily lysophospholipase